MKRTGRLRRQSPRRRQEHRTRIAYLEAIEADQKDCERCHRERATDCHEVLTRARGGSITDPANFRYLGRKCHDWITTHPLEAHAEGYVIHSWEAAK